MEEKENNQTSDSLPTQQKSSDVSSTPTEPQPQISPNVSDPPPSSQKNISKKLILIGLVFLIIVLTISGIYFYLQKHELNPGIQESPFPTPNQTANWKTYRNEKYGFETKYYSDSPPTEHEGTEEVGQFTHLFKVNFGTVPLKSQHGYILEVNKGKSLADWETDLIGHITDKVDSVEQITINNYSWTKVNYLLFATTENVPVTTAFINEEKYGYAITSPSSDIDQILSTIRFLPDTSDWNVYINKEFSLRFKYPNNWELVDYTPEFDLVCISPRIKPCPSLEFFRSMDVYPGIVEVGLGPSNKDKDQIFSTKIGLNNNIKANMYEEYTDNNQKNPVFGDLHIIKYSYEINDGYTNDIFYRANLKQEEDVYLETFKQILSTFQFIE